METEKLEEIAIDYHFNTENYDRMVCSSFNEKTNCAMPVDQHENSLIQKNAIDERRKAESRGAMIGCSRLQVGRAISEASRYFNFERELKKREKAPKPFLPTSIF